MKKENNLYSERKTGGTLSSKHIQVYHTEEQLQYSDLCEESFRSDLTIKNGEKCSVGNAFLIQEAKPKNLLNDMFPIQGSLWHRVFSRVP